VAPGTTPQITTKYEHLKDWLDSIHLAHLHANFIASGFDDLSAILHL
jgi:hypothetical protein